MNPNKTGKNCRVCNAAAKYKNKCLNDKLLAGPDLLHRLIGTIIRFWEGPIALTISNTHCCKCKLLNDKSCLRFLWWPTTNGPVKTNKNQRQVSGAKTSSTCANYAQKRLAINNEDESHRWSKSNAKKLPHGRFRRVSRHCWGSNQCFQTTATPAVETWFRTKKNGSPTSVEWPKKSLRTWDQSAAQSNWKWNLVRWAPPCLDFNGLLLKLAASLQSY